MASVEYAIGALTLQPGRQLLADGKPVPLGRKTLDILSALAQARGELVTKDELIDVVWPGLVVEDNAVQAHIVLLRKALGGEADRLKTVRGFGYRLALPGAAPRKTHPAPQAEAQSSVAVLPFANLTGDPANEYLGDGMAEELICTLSRADGLAVPARTSTFAYKGVDRDIREIGRELGVTAVLEGSVRLAGDRIRVTAQLINAATGFHLWSENYDRSLADLIGLQDDIAAAIASALRSKLAPARRRTADPEAFDLCLRGRSLLDRGSPANVLRAIDLFEKAVARDAGFSDARVGLSKALVYACSRGALGPEKYADALRQSRVAIDLDPGDAPAHLAFACAKARVGDWVTAGTCLERALELHEADADTHCIYGGGFLLFAGRIARAEYHALRACELAPAAAVAHVASANVAQYQARDQVMRGHIDAALELGFPEGANPLAVVRSRNALTAGDWQEAARLASGVWPQLAAAGEEDTVRTLYAAAAGHVPRQDGMDGVERLIARARAERWTGRYWNFSAFLLEWSLMLDAPALAYTVSDLILEGWAATGVLDIGCCVGLWLPGREHYREDPHFKAFFDRIGLTAYWDAFGPPQLTD